ncbi:HAD-IIB family hydrolase [Companilactobacillus nodensis]|nr:HAD-IIB family hydrolase [Companilactobacillus nodensis]
MKNFVFDIDGTISFNGQNIPDEIIASIKELMVNGHRVIFASARPIRDLLPVLPDEFNDNLLIGANGAMVSDNSKIKIINTINSEDAKFVFELITKYQLSYVVDSDWNYASQITENNCMYGQIDIGNFARQIPLSMIETPVKIILLDLNNKLLNKISESLRTNTDLAVVSHIGEGNLNITANDVNKYSTLSKLGITEYIAFGNDKNDVEMLQHAQSGVWITSKTSPLVDNQIECTADISEITKNINQFV